MARRPASHRRGRLWSRLGALVLALGVAWGGGFVYFLATLPPERALSPGFRVDGIVVLTGSGGRIRAGLEALERGVADRMLISGVHAVVGKGEIIGQYRDYAGLVGCCVDLGHSARNTIGNAGETAFWAEQNRFRSLLVITADYHMARSLTAFEGAMPGVRLVAYPVASRAGLATLAAEYSKFLVTATVARL
ncbi:uncharacterized SAM-binding protein YcdF (DUF218 family) [Rhodothalassium salexigens DSM 2132]|uniref:Uncharacterized SAM-binding protein YcdF (DUF218 family) n=1 Tax=Rhodothalassium salexigens DSM 2132 TaxID=1188247 RepID=A0A4R2PLW6_RHOSA|nr:YdcF family protein [Rhodothalassium salexigens]MBB4210875.1 uncharacterized SAM-binding protein YcdF (DUF218 family) [Rhodothalassium salexigens DSM 2132]TCP36467.1 uncharacterized SAM-binding protein YcdF (DUF218 family) [Rhodothalassium salexigens DSM 2132]